MDTPHHGWRLLLAAGAIVALGACGADAPPAQIDDPEPQAPSVVDDRPCADSPTEARAERRTLCVD